MRVLVICENPKKLNQGAVVMFLANQTPACPASYQSLGSKPIEVRNHIGAPRPRQTMSIGDPLET
jgi:hypothetical protein